MQNNYDERKGHYINKVKKEKKRKKITYKHIIIHMNFNSSQRIRKKTTNNGIVKRHILSFPFFLKLSVDYHSICQ